MADGGPDLAAPAEDQLLREMRVERVMRPDGRYLLYYDWPGAGSDVDRPVAPEPTRRDEDV